VIFVDEIKTNFEKTKDLVKIFDKYGWQNLLIIDDQEKSKGLAKFTKRLTNRDVLSVNGINVYDILRKDQLLITSAALKELEEKLQ
jgi:large subunit ribosomal protein L4